jgi:hypothetical protein
VSASLYLGEPTGPIKICGSCDESIVQIPSGVWLLATNDMTRDRVPCAKSADQLHHPAQPSPEA